MKNSSEDRWASDFLPEKAPCDGSRTDYRYVWWRRCKEKVYDGQHPVVIGVSVLITALIIVGVNWGLVRAEIKIPWFTVSAESDDLVGIVQTLFTSAASIVGLVFIVMVYLLQSLRGTDHIEDTLFTGLVNETNARYRLQVGLSIVGVLGLLFIITKMNVIPNDGRQGLLSGVVLASSLGGAVLLYQVFQLFRSAFQSTVAGREESRVEYYLHQRTRESIAWQYYKEKGVDRVNDNLSLSHVEYMQSKREAYLPESSADRIPGPRTALEIGYSERARRVEDVDLRELIRIAELIHEEAENGASSVASSHSQYALLQAVHGHIVPEYEKRIGWIAEEVNSEEIQKKFDQALKLRPVKDPTLEGTIRFITRRIVRAARERRVGEMEKYQKLLLRYVQTLADCLSHFGRSTVWKAEGSAGKVWRSPYLRRTNWETLSVLQGVILYAWPEIARIPTRDTRKIFSEGFFEQIVAALEREQWVVLDGFYHLFHQLVEETCDRPDIDPDTLLSWSKGLQNKLRLIARWSRTSTETELAGITHAVAVETLREQLTRSSREANYFVALFADLLLELVSREELAVADEMTVNLIKSFDSSKWNARRVAHLIDEWRLRADGDGEKLADREYLEAFAEYYERIGKGGAAFAAATYTLVAVIERQARKSERVDLQEAARAILNSTGIGDNPTTATYAFAALLDCLSEGAQYQFPTRVTMHRRLRGRHDLIAQGYLYAVKQSTGGTTGPNIEEDALIQLNAASQRPVSQLLESAAEKLQYRKRVKEDFLDTSNTWLGDLLEMIESVGSEGETTPNMEIKGQRIRYYFRAWKDE